MARYLLERNHKDLVVVTGKEKTWVNTERLAAVMEAMKEFGLVLREEDIIHADFTEKRLMNSQLIF